MPKIFWVYRLVYFFFYFVGDCMNNELQTYKELLMSLIHPSGEFRHSIELDILIKIAKTLNEFSEE